MSGVLNLFKEVGATLQARIDGLAPETPYFFSVCNQNIHDGNSCNTPIAVFTRPSGQGSQADPSAVSCEDTGGGGDVNGLAIAADHNGKLWEVVQNEAGVALGRFDSQGQLEINVSLPGAGEAGAWSVLFDAQNNPLAVGSAGSEDEQEVVVYKVAGDAGTLISSATVAGLIEKNDAAFDATGDAWITGATPAGNGNALALWRYCPHKGLLTLTTTYARGGGLDLGMGIKADPDGNLWVLGFSRNPDGGAVPFDLALWKFDPTGKNLLAGPDIRNGYLSQFRRFGAALAISSGTLFVAATETSEIENKTFNSGRA